MTKVEIYTDGACRGNPGPGGWAALLVSGKERKEVSGAESATTNNRMELQAAIGGLGALKRRCAVQLYTDSKYVLQGATEWLPNWKARGWLTSARAPVKNQDLWFQTFSRVASTFGRHRLHGKTRNSHKHKSETRARNALLLFIFRDQNFECRRTPRNSSSYGLSAVLICAARQFPP